MTLEIRNMPGPLGVEALGVDLSEPPDDATFAALKRAFEERSVLVIRDQRIAPEHHIAFSRRFGPLEVHVQKTFLLAGHPEILIVSNVMGEDGKPIGLTDAGRYWHSDLSYKAEPSLASLLHARELPRKGGDTLFISMHAAYEALSEDVRRRIDGLSAVHSYIARNAAQNAKNPLRPALDADMLAQVPEVVHPMVRVHPATGRKALFVSEGFTTRIVGLPEAESRELLDHLFRHMIDERFMYRHLWQPDDIVMWDNRATIHHATPLEEGQRRIMYRTTIRGDVPRGPEGEAVRAA